MATVQILSDLHLESPKAYDIFEIVPKAPYLALLGDIGNIVRHKEECLAFLMCQLRLFSVVLFVPGNHEAYGASWSETLEILQQFEEDVTRRRSTVGADALGLGHFVLLNRRAFELPDTDDDVGTRRVILGCSLFSYIPPKSEMAIEMGLQDFFQTTSWDAHMHNEAHARDLAWLNAQVGLLGGATRIAIFTHWSPTTDASSIDPQHKNSPITSGFATDLAEQPCFSSDNVLLWAFGHTHYNCDFTVERENAEPLRLLTNQRGYYFAQAREFDGEKVVEI